ncbi:hypothetical protein LZ32DRAFT_610522 [Colletotrichum eremochloae]|nr:hypothetical protein LY78DRAFT_663468 [Colletotrichum sublineola]KAK2007175.1 hypothetical protein LZ32DRAFT_610522 [Colletotrichum eremochloae]
MTTSAAALRTHWLRLCAFVQGLCVRPCERSTTFGYVSQFRASFVPICWVRTTTHPNTMYPPQIWRSICRIRGCECLEGDEQTRGACAYLGLIRAIARVLLLMPRQRPHQLPYLTGNTIDQTIPCSPAHHLHRLALCGSWIQEEVEVGKFALLRRVAA